MTRHGRVGQDRTGQDRTGQDKTGQDRTKQDMTLYKNVVGYVGRFRCMFSGFLHAPSYNGMDYQ